MNQIYPQSWISLPKATRHRLTIVFDLKSTGISEIRDQEVVSDGFTAEDLKGITLEKMNKYIGSTETFGRAWEVTLAKIHSELNPPIGEIKKVGGEPTIVDVVPPTEPVSVVDSLPAETALPDGPGLQGPIASGTSRNKPANGR